MAHGLEKITVGALGRDAVRRGGVFGTSGMASFGAFVLELPFSFVSPLYSLYLSA